MGKIKVAVLASGRGSNLRAIKERIDAGECNAEIILLIASNPEAPAISIAKAGNIPVEVVSKADFQDRESMDERIRELLDRHGAELVVLAGYMLLIKGRGLIESYRNRIINIHPSLLPSFPGATAQKDAFEYGVKVSGVTIHFVDESLDAGPIIHQEAVDISGCNSADEAASTILKAEHAAYAKVVDSFSKGTYKVEGRRVSFIPDK